MDDLTNNSPQVCTGCGSSSLGDECFLPNEPTILNYRFRDVAEANGVNRRDMRLRECLDCGLIFNAILDEAAIPYDERYENRQNFSGAFTHHLEKIADRLISNHELQGKGILDIGCGKGDFLRMICERSGGHGFGYDTSYEGDLRQSDPELKFFCHYLTPENFPGHSVGVIICRHVVEHIASIGEFLTMLCQISEKAGRAPVYIETPAWEWIAENRAFWDIFYEHCNYFPTSTLRGLAERAGFEVLRHDLVFGDQYQALELIPRLEGSDATKLETRPGLSLKAFGENMTLSQDSLEAQLANAGYENGWAIWGAGAKGVSLANRICKHPPKFLVDVNPSKQGAFVPGAGISVVSPEDPNLSSVSVILVANANYLNEIRDSLAKNGHTPQLIAI